MTEEDVKQDRYYPDGGYGWIIVAAIVLINSSVLILVKNLALIFGPEFKAEGITGAEIGFLLHFQSSLYCIFGLVTSPFLKKYGYRKVALVGSALMCLGVLLTSFSTSYTYLVFSYSILLGIGQGTLMPATYYATYCYFKKRLTIAVSLTVTGASLSSIFMPKICVILMKELGRQNTVLVLFGICLLSVPCSALMRPVPKRPKTRDESVLETLNQPEEISVHKSELKKERASLLKKIYLWFDLKLLKIASYVIIVLGLGISFAAETNIDLLMQFIIKSLAKFSDSDVAYASGVKSVTDVISRLAVPFLSVVLKAPPELMYCLSLVLASIGRLILAEAYEDRISVFACVALIGISKGSKAVFQSVIIPKHVPLEKLPTANGLNMLFTGIVSLIIGPIIGWIHDASGSYVLALHADSLVSLSCVVLWSFFFLFRRYKKRRNQHEIGNEK